MKNPVILLSFLFFVSIVSGCGGNRKPKAADAEEPEEVITGILDYDAPYLPGIEPVDEYRDFRSAEPVITENTKRVVLPDFETDYQFHDGMMAIKNRQTGKWGFMDTEGNTVIDFVWNANSPRFNNGVAVVGKLTGGYAPTIGHWTIIDKQGNIVKEFDSSVRFVSQFTDGYAYVHQDNLRRVYYINTKGERIFESFTNDYKMDKTVGDNFKLRPLSDGMVALYHIQSGTWGFGDRQGNVVIPPKFLNVSEFNEGLAAVKFPATESSAAKWGVIDKQGNTVIEPVFTNPLSAFSEGYAIATQVDNKQVYIDTEGKVVSPEYKKAYPFKNGIAIVHQANEELGFIDRDFNILKDRLFITEFEDGVYGSKWTVPVYFKNPVSPQIDYFGDKYFALHDNGTSASANSGRNLYYLDGTRHTLTAINRHFSRTDTEYRIGNFYGNLAHITYQDFKNDTGPLDGIIDFNKGLEFVILFEKSKF